MSARWTSDDVPSQRGRLALVTGANTGVGLETAGVLAAAARLIMDAHGCRRPGLPGGGCLIGRLDCPVWPSAFARAPER
jgi:hypothetical protein